MNAPGVNPPAMPASMAAASGDGNGPTRSFLWVPPTRPSAAAQAATSAAWPAGVGGAATERYPSDAAGRLPGDVRSMRCSASIPLSPACWLCILPPRPLSAFDWDGTAKVSALTSGADPRSTGPATLSSPVGVPAPAPVSCSCQPRRFRASASAGASMGLGAPSAEDLLTRDGWPDRSRRGPVRLVPSWAAAVPRTRLVTAAIGYQVPKDAPRLLSGRLVGAARL